MADKKSSNFNNLHRKREPIRVSLEELVAIFDDEAARVCFTKKEAQILATAALSDFLNHYAKNVIVR